MPNPFVHSMLKASPKYTQFPVSSLGSSKERAQMGVITQESPTTKSTKESCTQPHIKAMLRAQCREWILTLLLLLTGGQRTTCTQHRGTGTGKNQDAMCLLSPALNQIKLRMTLTYNFGTAPEQGSTAYIPTLTPPVWKKKEQCTAKQLQLRDLKNLEFSQVSGFYAVKKPNQNNNPKPKQNNSTTRPSPNATLPLYCSQNKTTWKVQEDPALEVSDLKYRRNTQGGELIKHTCNNFF